VADEATHRTQASAHEGFVRLLIDNHADDPTALQWAVTAAFYCAVHCVEAHLATYSLDSKTHRQREAHMVRASLNVPAEVYSALQQLKQWSEQGRYHGRAFDEAFVRNIVLGLYLTRVTSFIGL
jgi:hypothetical protein